MSAVNRIRASRWHCLILPALMIALLSAGPASAQGLFSFLFGETPREPPPQARSHSVSAPTAATQRPAQPSMATGRSASYCVRLCDGRFFPISHNAAASPARVCSALCPSSQTKVFFGSNAAHAIAADGTRYSSLQNAFLYRKQLVADCTCNGRDHFGLASIDPKSDPTSRAGDMLMTESGQVTATGHQAKRTAFDNAVTQSN